MPVNIRFRDAQGAWINPCIGDIYIKTDSGALLKVKNQDEFYNGTEQELIDCCDCKEGTLVAARTIEGTITGEIIRASKTFGNGFMYVLAGRNVTSTSTSDSTLFKINISTGSVVGGILFKGLLLSDILLTDGNMLHLVGCTTPLNASGSGADNKSVYIALSDVDFTPLTASSLDNSDNNGRETFRDIYPQNNTVGVDNFNTVIGGFIFDSGSSSSGLQDRSAVYYFNTTTSAWYGRCLRISGDPAPSQSDVEYGNVLVGDAKHLLIGQTESRSNKAHVILLDRVDLSLLSAFDLYTPNSPGNRMFGTVCGGRDIVHIEGDKYLAVVDDLTNASVNLIVVSITNMDNAEVASVPTVLSAYYIENMPSTTKRIKKVGTNTFIVPLRDSNSEEIVLKVTEAAGELTVDDSIKMRRQGDVSPTPPIMEVEGTTLTLIAARSRPSYPTVPASSFYYLHQYDVNSLSSVDQCEDVANIVLTPLEVLALGSTSAFVVESFVSTQAGYTVVSEEVEANALSKCDYV